MEAESTDLSLVLVAVLAVGIAVELFRERIISLHFNRGVAIFIALCGVAITGLQSIGFRWGAEPIDMNFIQQPSPPFGGDYLTDISFEGGPLFSVVSMMIFFGGVLFCPSTPLVRVRMSRVLLMQGLIVALAQAKTMIFFLSIASVLVLSFILSVRHHARSLREDLRGEARSRTFMVYQGIAVAAMVFSLYLRVFDYVGVLPATSFWWAADLISLCLAATLVVGLFPFHGWVVPFLGAPRSTVFLPMFVVQTGLLFFFRLYAPIVAGYQAGAQVFLFVPVVGLLYASLLFFSEQRLKRIPGYLYMSHVSLMALSAIGLGHEGLTASMLDGINVLIAILGLMGVCALLTSRFGVRGVSVPTGLGAIFPELAVCYLVCVLSLVGFPGTLGFTEEEVMLGQGVEHQKFLVAAIAVALTLNGFSSFRLFARVFYGQPFSGSDPETSLQFRERGMIYLILGAIILNGIAPSFLVRTLTSLSQ